MLVRQELRVEYVPDDPLFVDDVGDPSGKNAHGFGYAEGPADGAIHVAGKKKRQAMRFGKRTMPLVRVGTDADDDSSGFTKSS